MTFARLLLVNVFLVVASITVHEAGAIIPVTDVGAIVQLISQLQVLEQQAETARHQLEQAQSEYRSITGDRGMERLLSGTVRNYLPATWDDVQSAVSGAQGAYGTLATGFRSALTANAVLSGEQLAALSADAHQALEAGRRTAALLQVLPQQALAQTSERFASLQQLIDAIGSATDAKAILDLQARIGAEQAMIENDNIKLRLIHEAALADDRVNRQRLREAQIAAQGQFATRFQPVPPRHPTP